MKKTVSLLAVLVTALGFAASASASSPDHVTVTISVTTPDPTQPNFSCVPFGYGWDVLSTFTVTRSSTLYYDHTGNLAKEIRHVDFTGTLYRSDDLFATIPYAGKFTRTFDPATNTITITGLSAYTHPDGSGMLALDPGRTVANPPAPPITDTGPTRIEWQMAVC